LANTLDNLANVYQAQGKSYGQKIESVEKAGSCCRLA
jgi:hypothetical protein